MAYEYSFLSSRLQLDTVHAALAASYWSPGVSRETVARAIESSIVIGAYDKTAQVGFARVVSDKATFAWLCDVIVLEAHRGNGIGTEMVRRLIEHPELGGLRRWCLATQDAHGLYERFGFLPVAENTWMVRQPAH